MSTNLPTRLFAIIFRTEHKATHLHMTLGHTPKSIQLNTQGKKKVFRPSICTCNWNTELKTIILKSHINTTYNGKTNIFITQTFSLFEKAEQTGYF